MENYFSNQDLFQLFNFDPEANESETLNILWSSHDMSWLEENQFVWDHIKELQSNELVSGVSDNGVLFQVDNEMTDEM